MAEYGSRSPQDGDSTQGLGPDEKPRLTEEEKKQNHIASGTHQHILLHSSHMEVVNADPST